MKPLQQPIDEDCHFSDSRSLYEIHRDNISTRMQLVLVQIAQIQVDVIGHLPESTYSVQRNIQRIRCELSHISNGSI